MNTSSLEAYLNQEMFDFTPSSFSIKEAQILGIWVPHLLSQLAFWKDYYSLPQQLISQFLGLLWGKQHELGLSNKFWCSSQEPWCSWLAGPVGRFSGKALTDARTTCSEDLPLKILQISTGYPSTWQLEWGTFGNWQASYSRVSCSGVYSQEPLFPLCLGLFLWNKSISLEYTAGERK